MMQLILQRGEDRFNDRAARVVLGALARMLLANNPGLLYWIGLHEMMTRTGIRAGSFEKNRLDHADRRC